MREGVARLAEVDQLEPSVVHAAAITALAGTRLAALGAALTVYLDEVPADPLLPYAVFWTAAGTPAVEAGRLSGWGGEVSTTTQATVCGYARADVIGGVDRLVRALHRRKPVLPGRVPGDIDASGGGGPPIQDPVPAAGGRPVWTSAVFFALTSSPRNST